MVWNYYFISARWSPPLRINKVKVNRLSLSPPSPLLGTFALGSSPLGHLCHLECDRLINSHSEKQKLKIDRNIQFSIVFYIHVIVVDR